MGDEQTNNCCLLVTRFLCFFFMAFFHPLHFCLPSYSYSFSVFFLFFLFFLSSSSSFLLIVFPLFLYICFFLYFLLPICFSLTCYKFLLYL